MEIQVNSSEKYISRGGISRRSLLLAVLVFALVLLVRPLVVGDSSVVDHRQMELSQSDQLSEQVESQRFAEVEVE